MDPTNTFLASTGPMMEVEEYCLTAEVGLCRTWVVGDLRWWPENSNIRTNRYMKRKRGRSLIYEYIIHAVAGWRHHAFPKLEESLMMNEPIQCLASMTPFICACVVGHVDEYNTMYYVHTAHRGPSPRKTRSALLIGLPCCPQCLISN